jgi:hypothetical protein
MRFTNDALTELVRAAQSRLQGWPTLSKAPLAREGHIAVADEPELLTDMIEFVEGKEALKALCVKVKLVELESLRILGVDDGISQ